MKHIFVDSYYSEVDFRDNDFARTDGFFEVWCQDENQFKEDVEKTYENLQDTGENVNTIELVLEELHKQGKIAAWQKWNYLRFDCDYGTFES